MNFDRTHLLLYAVTDRSWLRGERLSAQVEKALKGGATMVQLREKQLGEEEFRREAEELLRLCRSYGVPLIINDNVALAKEIGADGVHVGQDDMGAARARQELGPDKIIGVSAHSVEEALEAERQGADYLGVGAVFHTGSKPDASLLSHETLRRICRASALPAAAIGGITSENIGALRGTGIAGAAVISALFAQPDIEAAARRLRRQLLEVTGAALHTALTIAGSDSSGGAGIQADIKTMLANGVYAMSAVTALTAQNTTGVADIMEVTPEFLGEQLDSVFTDIWPEAVKIGMVSSGALISVIAEKLAAYGAKNVVVDPVMVATSGARLIDDGAVEQLTGQLLPLASLLTPNIPETEVLAQMPVRTAEDMVRAAQTIRKRYHCSVLVKGGHQRNEANDLLCSEAGCLWFEGRRISNPNTHGTGCTLSSAIASNLAKGFSLEESVRRAKDYISGALGAMLDLGKGSGPMNHGFAITGEFVKGTEGCASDS